MRDDRSLEVVGGIGDDRAVLATRLERHARHARGALAPSTERAFRSDSAVFAAWCAGEGRESLPASIETIVEFIDAMAQVRLPATIRRYVSSISTQHRAAGLPNPTAALEVKLALKRMSRARGVRQAQAAPLSRARVDRMIAACGNRLRDLRDLALLAVAYDTLARRSEIVALDLGDVTVAEDGSGTVLIRRSKADQEGAGQVRFLAPDTMTALYGWLSAAAITEGAIFRSVRKGGRIGKRLSGEDVAVIFRSLAKRAGIDSKAISGHSTRVGAAQDMAAAGFGTAEIMQVGGWKSPTMVARYTERIGARRGAAAKLAALQGRI